MLRILIVPVALVLLSLPSGASAACKDGVRVSTGFGVDLGKPVPTRVLVCRNGRERVIRRGFVRYGRTGRGTAYTDAALVGRRLAIAKYVARAGRVTHVVELRSWPGDRLRFRRTRVTRRAPVVGLEVALSPRGVFAWSGLGGLVVRRTTGRRDVLDASGGTELEVDEDGTLRWGGYGAPRFRDLDPIPRHAGCPRRTGYTTVLETPEVRVTRRDHRRTATDSTVDVLRACLPGTGRDVVVRAGGGGDSEWFAIAAVAAQGPFVLTVSRSANKYDGCAGADFGVSDARTGRRTREAVAEPGYASQPPAACTADAVIPATGDPLAISTAGVPAWVRGGVLRTIAANGKVAELDRGAITGLRAEGTTVHWRRDGVDRSAAL